MATLDLEEQRKKRLSYNYFPDRKPLLYQILARPDEKGGGRLEGP